MKQQSLKFKPASSLGQTNSKSPSSFDHAQTMPFVEETLLGDHFTPKSPKNNNDEAKPY